MPPLRLRLLAGLVALVALSLAAGAPVGAAPSDSPALPPSPMRSVYLRAPRGASPGAKLQVLVALHGMGGNGPDFAHDLIDQADRYGWLIVAPTIDYGDWRDPAVIAREDPQLVAALAAYLDGLPQRTGFQVRRHVLLLGHSRGAQLAHRFAELQPDRVLAAATLSAGDYTLPLQTSAQGKSLSFPFGVKDLERYTGHPFNVRSFDDIQFWVGVGGDDTNPGDVPRQWDAYEGSTRVQRARAFEAAVRQLGATTELRVFSGAQHDLTPEMRRAACTFLDRAEQSAGASLGSPLTADALPV